MSELRKRILFGTLLAAVAVVCIFTGLFAVAVGAAVLCVSCLYEFFRMIRTGNALKSWVVYAGLVFIIASFGSALALRSMRQGDWWLFLSVAAASLCDTGAFTMGKFFGKHKLAPAISPGKTLEGAFGGILFSMLGVVLIGRELGMALVHRLSLGLVLAVAAILGDLLESVMKRKTGIKDSGSVMPGHGGILDRLDSHLLTLPTLLLYKIFFFS